MVSQVQAVAKDEVGHWAALDTDVSSLYFLDEGRTPHYVEAVAYSLGADQNGIIDLSVVFRIRLSSVAVDVERLVFVLSLCFGIVDLREELLNRRSEVLFLDHVETNAHVSELLALKHSIDGGLNLLFGHRWWKTLQTARDDLHLEEREHVLDGLLDSFKDGYFLLYADGTILIEDHAKDMLPLDHSHHLLHEVLADSIQDRLKELRIVVQIHRQVELGLESLPDLVRFLSVDGLLVQQNQVLQVLVEGS